MASYDKEKKIFPQRSKGTIKPFPELNREALAYVLDALNKKYTQGNIDLTAFDENDRIQFQELLKRENFAKMYSWAIEKVTPASVDQLAVTNGQWVKYPKGSRPDILVASLQGHGTGWCTAGESTAKIQLQSGDFYVYYSFDRNGKPTVPRVAIRMEDDKIGEVRGVAKEQNLDPYIDNVVRKKLDEFPDGNLYEKRVNDMKKLTEISRKTEQKQKLTRDELVFLYEINGKIEGFGYQRDPRISEIRAKRDPKEDAPAVFGCAPDEIAWDRKSINERTKAYIGSLFSGIFDTLGDLEYVYTSFPEGKISRETVVAGGRSVQVLERELKQRGINVGSYAQQMMRNNDFVTLKRPEQVDLVHLKVGDLGLKEYPTTDQIYQKAKELGLELCPPEVGPELRLKYLDQPLRNWLYVGMKQITGSGGHPSVFELVRDEDGLWLNGCWARPGFEWYPASSFVFRLRK